MLSKNLLRLAAVPALSAFVTFAPATHAHVTLEWQSALAGTYYKAVFKVGHGCGSSPTRQVVVDLPEGVRGARPMPRPGWTVEITRATLARPYTSHGRTVTEDVTRITWTARSAADMLDAAHYGEFILQAQLPPSEGRLHWPVRQVCPEGRLDWVQVPVPGQPLSDLPYPAAVLDILPSSHASGHSH